MSLEGPHGDEVGRARLTGAGEWDVASDVAVAPAESDADGGSSQPVRPGALNVRLLAGAGGEPSIARAAAADRGSVPDTMLAVTADGVTRTVEAYRDGDAIWLVDDGVPTRWAPLRDDARRHLGSGSLDAPMPGVVLDVRAASGAAVAEGDVLIVLESMKMELAVVSPADGVVGEVHVRAGDHVAQGQVLIAVEAA
jgi:biotin carboxyl carrier protein